MKAGPSRRCHPCCALSEGGSQGMSAALNPTLLGDAKAQIDFGKDPHACAGPGSVKGDRERVEPGSVVELDTAVKQERYGDAARHKKRLQEIQAADTVAAVQRELQANLAAEQYGAAADLRDRGLVGLSGWWAGKDGPDDFQGHLLHVKAEFGRWTGRIYMARDIASLNGWRENKLMQLLDRVSDRNDRSGGGLRGAVEAAGGLGGGTVGTPMLEVFVRQQDAGPARAGSSGSSGGSGGGEQQQQLVPGLLVHQAVALRPPAAKAAAAVAGREVKQQGGGAAAAGGGSGRVKLNPATVVRLSIHVAADGSARISVLPPKPVKSEFNSWEEEEMRATMAALAGDSLPPAPASRRSPAASAAKSGSAGGAASDDGFQRPDDDDDDEDFLTELTRVPAQVALHGRDRFTFSVVEDASAVAGSAEAGSDIGAGPAGALEDLDAYASGSGVDLSRWAVPIDDDDEERNGEGVETVVNRSEAPTASQGRTGADATEAKVVEVLVDLPASDEPSSRRSMLDAADEAAELAAAKAALAGGSDEESDDEEGTVSVSMDMLSVGYGTVDAVATSVSDGVEQSITIEIPVSRLMVQQQQQRDADAARRGSGAAAGTSSGARGARRVRDTFDRLAERVAQLQAARAGRPVPPENLATALRTLAQRLVDGELAADGSSSATATVPSAAAAARAQKVAPYSATPSSSRTSSSVSRSSSSASAPGASGATRISYSRIPTDLPRTDPFCGLYLGAFGPHGPELIQLNRGMQDGEEVVCATKVTGDPNVPAGEVSFRAKVGRRHRLDSRDVYPEELGIMARYKGEGRVAMAGYKSPRWVDGELLVFKVGASPVTSGAELGFVWSVPGEKRFLILLNKLDLKECEK
ncbi:hypothetical protein GPECTOR_1g351 [Gonium pectorale]|uniref:Uncharacterized protein n=1 Tax=Gonium pectorale TaxID=33097 RepID=A0A150H2J7_GONPE|nr:hypothetical protein GPECTOR_1g351 [Gonium pectorale]|eukprot:KXZ56396.1 hypothetical protein GPECTOR_1g351 [Gonium pectorale]